MGRPQAPLDRNGTPALEFAFWLRDLRNRSGLTYTQLARSAHYATSTMQDAAAGHRLPTLRVVKAFVRACGGDVAAWTEYWTQVSRLLDPHSPQGIDRSLEPPWANGTDRDEPDHVPVSAADGWYVESFAALLRLDAEPVEAVERRVIVATVDGLSEIATSISVPRHPEDAGATHALDAEILHGGALEQRDQPYETFFRNVIALPQPLRAGDRHEYALRLSIPRGQPMAPHYVHVPFRRSDYFDVRIRFSPHRPPGKVWVLSGVPTAVIYERNPAAKTLSPDRFGEVHAAFRGLRLGLGYGLSWQGCAAAQPDEASPQHSPYPRRSG